MPRAGHPHGEASAESSFELIQQLRSQFEQGFQPWHVSDHALCLKVQLVALDPQCDFALFLDQLANFHVREQSPQPCLIVALDHEVMVKIGDTDFYISQAEGLVEPGDQAPRNSVNRNPSLFSRVDFNRVYVVLESPEGTE
jgi:hypothetical protein